MNSEQEFAVTGIRHTLAKGKPKDEQTRVCEAFLRFVVEGQEVYLIAEPDNINDEEAIAVYTEFMKFGYISRENTSKVATYFDENQQCKAVVKRTDHVTCWVTIQGEPKRPQKPRPRVLPASPLEGNVKMPFTDAEHRLCFIASRLASIEVSKANIREIADFAANYVPLLKLSICNEEGAWMDTIYGKLRDVCSRAEELGLTEREAAAMKCICDIVGEAVGDMHCTSDNHIERIFAEHLGRLRADKAATDTLFQRYCETHLGGKSFCEADKALVTSEHDRLTDWLRGMKWPELRDPKDMDRMARKVKYLRLSRKELYDLYSVMLILERLEAACHVGLLDVFWKRVAEARETLITSNRLWFVPCKWLMWKGFVKGGDFRSAVSMLQEHFPDLKLDAKDLSKLNTDCFSKPFSQWSEGSSSVKGKVYEKYHALAAFLMQE